MRAAEACKGNFLGAFDVTAGPLGDPFFIATLPTDPATAFSEPERSEYGLYEVHVNYMGQEHTVIVDDFVPAIDGRPISACSESQMMWPLIYEKACAKVAGSYQALSALRHNEITISSDLKIDLPAESEVHNFVAPCLSAAALLGCDIGDFAQEFKDPQYLEDCREGISSWDSGSTTTTVGTFNSMQFHMCPPSKFVKVNVDTNVHIECNYSQETAGQHQVAVVVLEMTDKMTGRMIRGSVSDKGQTSVVVVASLEATGNRYLVYVGSTCDITDTMPELDLEILSDTEVEYQDV